MTIEKVEELLKGINFYPNRYTEYYSKKVDKDPNRPDRITIPDEIVATGDADVALSFLLTNCDKLSDRACNYLVYKVRNLNKFREAEQKYADKKAKSAELEHKPNGDIVLKDVKLTERQGTDNGCWSCAYSLLLKSRGVDLPQEVIRAHRSHNDKNEVLGDKYSFNRDVALNPTEKPDILMNLVPNTGLKEIGLVIQDNNLRQKFSHGTFCNVLRESVKNDLSKFIKENVKDTLEKHNSPVALLLFGHFVTVVGMKKDGSLLIYDSNNLDRSGEPLNKRIEDLLDVSVDEAHRSIAMVSLQDIAVDKADCTKSKFSDETSLDFTVNPNGDVTAAANPVNTVMEDEDKSAKAQLSLSGGTIGKDKIVFQKKIYVPKKLNLNVQEVVVENEVNNPVNVPPVNNNQQPKPEANVVNKNEKVEKNTVENDDDFSLFNNENIILDDIQVGEVAVNTVNFDKSQAEGIFRELDENKRPGFFWGTKKDSDLYTAVKDSLSKFNTEKDLPMSKDLVNLRDIKEKCEKYLTKRSNPSSPEGQARYELVEKALVFANTGIDYHTKARDERRDSLNAKSKKSATQGAVKKFDSEYKNANNYDKRFNSIENSVSNFRNRAVSVPGDKHMEIFLEYVRSSFQKISTAALLGDEIFQHKGFDSLEYERALAYVQAYDFLRLEYEPETGNYNGTISDLIRNMHGGDFVHKIMQNDICERYISVHHNDLSVFLDTNPIDFVKDATSSLLKEHSANQRSSEIDADIAKKKADIEKLEKAVPTMNK